MIRTPREIEPRSQRCTCKRCDVCLDPLTAAWISDSEATVKEKAGDVAPVHGPDWTFVNKPRHAAPPRDHQPLPTVPDIQRRHVAAVDAFNTRMADLIRRVRGGHGTD